MDDPRTTRIIKRRDVTRRALRVVPDPAPVEPIELAPEPGTAPRTIGRLIAQTALLADSALNRKRRNEAAPRPNSRRFGRFF